MTPQPRHRVTPARHARQGLAVAAPRACSNSCSLAGPGAAAARAPRGPGAFRGPRGPYAPKHRRPACAAAAPFSLFFAHALPGPACVRLSPQAEGPRRGRPRAARPHTPAHGAPPLGASVVGAGAPPRRLLRAALPPQHLGSFATGAGVRVPVSRSPPRRMRTQPVHKNCPLCPALPRAASPIPSARTPGRRGAPSKTRVKAPGARIRRRSCDHGGIGWREPRARPHAACAPRVPSPRRRGPLTRGRRGFGWRRVQCDAWCATAAVTARLLHIQCNPLPYRNPLRMCNPPNKPHLWKA